MTIERVPHRPAAAFWGTWVIFSIVTLFTGAMTLWWIWLGSFLAVELPASLIDTGKRDTLSEVATWVQRKLSKHKIFGRGWNAFMLIIVDILSMTGTMPMWLEHRDLVLLVQSPLIAGLVGIWLYDHWVDPVTHG